MAAYKASKIAKGELFSNKEVRGGWRKLNHFELDGLQSQNTYRFETILCQRGRRKLLLEQCIYHLYPKISGRVGICRDCDSMPEVENCYVHYDFCVRLRRILDVP